MYAILFFKDIFKSFVRQFWRWRDLDFTIMDHYAHFYRLSNYSVNIILIAIFLLIVSCIRSINYQKQSSFLYHTVPYNFNADRMREGMGGGMKGSERMNEQNREKESMTHYIICCNRTIFCWMFRKKEETSECIFSSTHVF